MESGFTIRKNRYYDSVFLMGINNQISKVEGIKNSAVLMGTENNKKLLAEIGISDLQIDEATPNDLIVAVIADSSKAIRIVLDDLDHWFDRGSDQKTEVQLKTLEDGLIHKPDANLVAISVPGKYAFREAKKVLEKGINVFLFSDNVPISEELALKEYANENGLMVMGPDCGTSIINGIGIGFANNVRKGDIGVVGASGTGLQEFTSQIHNAGSGISHAIGTGSHDLYDDIGGITTLMAVQALESDLATKVIVIISKPPGKRTLNQLNQFVTKIKKPVIGCFLGVEKGSEPEEAKIKFVRTIDEAVSQALRLSGRKTKLKEGTLTAAELDLARREQEKFGMNQKYVRGLFAGGTFCYQAQQILQDANFEVYSNSPINKKYKLVDPDASIEHTVVDLGDDHYTVSKPHPMIDGTFRRNRILDESQDPQVAILLLDFILGYNASADPVGDLLDAIVEAKQVANQRGDHLCVVASMCGTEDDFQDLNLQVKMLEEIGAIVFFSNAKATQFCVQLIKAN